MKGRTIRIYLAEGVATGLLTAEVINWTGKVIVAPRAQLPDLAKREEVKRSGIYILTGEDPNNPTKEQVYIGESDNVFSRLYQHNKDATKEFWSRTIVIVSKDENLTKSHVRYLESRLIQLATLAHRATLTNGTNPEATPLPESDRADMEYFLEQIQILLPALGFTFVLPTPTVAIQEASVVSSTNTQPKSPTFNISISGTYADAQELDGEFVVFKGATTRKIDTPSLGRTYVELRKRLREEGKLVDSDQDGVWIFTEDIAFQSPTAAASVVAGSQVNGRISWKVKGTQQTYGDWQDSQIEKTNIVADPDEEPVALEPGH